jgi:DNA-binding response OmpR family regulator
VEDDQPTLEMMKIRLPANRERTGQYRMFVFGFGKALKRVRTDPPALVLLDVMITPVIGW